MNSRILGILILATFSLSAAAMPHASLNQIAKQSDPNCNQQGSSNGLKDLVQQVNLVADDDGVFREPRGPLTQKATELGFSAGEVAQIKKTVGDIVCSGHKNKNGNYKAFTATAFLVGDGGQILTNRHVFVDEKGKYREPLENCFFQNKEWPYTPVAIDLGPNRNKLKFITSGDPQNKSFIDLAVVSLKGRISGAIPFRLDTSGTRLTTKDKLLVVSADQLRMTVPLERETHQVVLPDRGIMNFEFSKEAVATSCKPRARTPDFILTDCSTTVGGSGSPVFVRLASGELVIKAVHAESGLDAADKTPYTADDKAPKGPSFTASIQIDQNISNQIEYFIAANSNTRMAVEENPNTRVRNSGNGF